MYLNCKTNFSFRYGTCSTAELVTRAVDLGIHALALTNINSTSDLWDFVQTCEKNSIKPVPGVEIRNGDEFLYILLAVNNSGITWINRFLSIHLQSNTPFPSHSPTNTVGDDHVFVIYPPGR